MFLLALNIYGQSWTKVIEEGDNFEEAILKVDAYYTEHPQSHLDYKLYRRWQEYARHRLSKDGRAVNVSAINYSAYQSLKKSMASQRSTHGDWEEIGPFDYVANDSWSGGGLGRINCTAFHPTNNQIMWVGTAGGGMWKTTNGGSTWFSMTDAFSSIGISEIVLNPSDPNIIYLLTGDSEASPPNAGFPGKSSVGVLKTTDGGVTWKPTGLSYNVSQNVYPTKLIIHPTNGEILFATMKSQGIMRTTNGGTTWTQYQSGRTVWDIEFAIDLPDVIVAISDTGLLRSITGGATWIVDNDPSFPASYQRAEIAMSESNPENVYIVFGGDTNVPGTFNGLYKSTDFGATFTMQSNTPNILDGTLGGTSGTDQAWYDLSIVVDPSDDSKVFVGGVNLWKSEDDGATWSRETWWTRNYVPTDPYVHADWHDLYFRDNRLVANVDGGIYYTEDFGNSWTELTSGLSIMQFYEIDILNDEYIGGSQDNGTNGGDLNGDTCDQLWGGDGFGAVWHTGDNSIQYISNQNAIYRRQFGTSIPISPIELGDNDYWFTEIEMHTTDPDYVFVTSNPPGGGEKDLFRGNGDAFGFDWDDLGISDIVDCQIEGFVQGESNDEVMYVASCELVFKTSNLGATAPDWLPLNLPFYSDGNPVDVEINTTNEDHVWVAISGYLDNDKVWYSSNGGDTWINYSGALPNVSMNCLVFAPNSSDGIYVGTDIGVFYRDATLSDWVYFSNFLPNVQVFDMKVSGGILYVGTHGRGLWKSPTFSSCPENITLTTANDPSNPYNPGTQFYHASNSINSSRLIGGGIGSDIHYQSGNFTDLVPGFWVKAESSLEVKVGGCPD